MATRPNLKIKIFADGAQLDAMVKRYEEGWVKGFTTNPTLMAKAGIREYEDFARAVLKKISDLSISFEVFADEFSEMEVQAKRIATWGSNVYVKIPIMNTKGESSLALIRRLLDAGLKLNVTAICDPSQWKGLAQILRAQDDVIVSIFAGRIADTGRDPVPMMREAVAGFKEFPHAQVLWASPREVLNLYQADQVGCQIITMTDDLIEKTKLFQRDLMDYSRATVQMFYDDATRSGFSLQ